MFKPMINLSHIIFAVPDLETSLTYYRDTLDFKVHFDERDVEIKPGSGSIISVALVERADDVIGMIELVQFVSSKPNPMPERGYYDLGYWAAVWEVKDLDRIYDEWKARDVNFVVEPNYQTIRNQGDVYSALIKDVDLNLIELVQPID